MSGNLSKKSQRSSANQKKIEILIFSKRASGHMTGKGKISAKSFVNFLAGNLGLAAMCAPKRLGPQNPTKKLTCFEALF